MKIDREKLLLSILEQEKLDAIVTIAGPNQRRITGANFSLSERPTLIVFFADGEIVSVIPFLEKEVYESLNLGGQAYFWKDSDGYEEAFRFAFQHRKLKKIGVEGQRFRFFELLAMQKFLPNSEFVDANLLISSVRLQKQEEEITKLRKAIDISEKALISVIPEIREGKTEKQIQAYLIQALFQEGAESLSFLPIVAFGANSSNPHASSLESNILQSGDAILIDFGATYQGYHADITRTVFFQNASEKARRAYQAVYEANQVGILATTPEQTCHYIDNLVLDSLEKTEFAENILHKTGHGIGLEVHEYPYLRRGNYTKLEAGVTITIEPGLYFSNEFGIRIEDDVLVTHQGCEVLTHLSKELTIISP